MNSTQLLNSWKSCLKLGVIKKLIDNKLILPSHSMKVIENQNSFPFFSRKLKLSFHLFILFLFAFCLKGLSLELNDSNPYDKNPSSNFREFNVKNEFFISIPGRENAVAQYSLLNPLYGTEINLDGNQLDFDILNLSSGGFALDNFFTPPLLFTGQTNQAILINFRDRNAKVFGGNFIISDFNGTRLGGTYKTIFTVYSGNNATGTVLATFELFNSGEGYDPVPFYGFISKNIFEDFQKFWPDRFFKVWELLLFQDM
jgi:hypothetical protein